MLCESTGVRVYYARNMKTMYVRKGYMHMCMQGGAYVEHACLRLVRKFNQNLSIFSHDTYAPSIVHVSYPCMSVYEHTRLVQALECPFFVISCVEVEVKPRLHVGCSICTSTQRGSYSQTVKGVHVLGHSHLLILLCYRHGLLFVLCIDPTHQFLVHFHKHLAS